MYPRALSVLLLLAFLVLTNTGLFFFEKDGDAYAGATGLVRFVLTQKMRWGTRECTHL
jgi:hypothetical protein